MPVPALQWLWSICDQTRVQFIAIVLSVFHRNYNDGTEQTFRNAQNLVSAFDHTHGYRDEAVRLFDLTQAQYPIVWRNAGDWDRYVGAYAEVPYFDEMGEVRMHEVPDFPGIAIIDLTRVPSRRGPREPETLETPNNGKIYAVLSGRGTILGHDVRNNRRLIGYSNLNATSNWVDRQISRLLGNPLTFSTSYRISHLNLSLIRRYLGDAIEVRYGKEFQLRLEKYLLTYLQKGMKPPAPIAPAILNMADDYLNGKSMELGLGDHFAIKNYLQKKKALAKITHKKH